LTNSPKNRNKPTVFISKEQIQLRVVELAQEIRDYFLKQTDFANDSLVVVGVLKGAAIFTADLLRALDLPSQLEFVRIASYGDSTQSSGILNIPDLALPDISGRHILVVEDIVDTGKTASFLTRYLQDQFNPKTLKLASLLDKPSRRVVEINPDFAGFEIEDKFVIGYGLDWAERYRELDYLGFVDES
jgi:hypoxanthine phosphoribosyltransferase